MAANIKFDFYKTFIKEINDGLYEIYLCLLGNPFNEDKTNIIYTSNTANLFLNEFEEVVLNNLDHEKPLKAYFEEVYYNGIGNLLVWAKNLQKIRLSQLGEDIGRAVNDEIFLKISNGYKATLGLFASKIYDASQKYNLIKLKPWIELERKDYNISGQFIGLFRTVEEKSTLNQELVSKISQPPIQDNFETNPELTFAEFLTKDGLKILPDLISEYENATPKTIFFMLCALSDLGLLSNGYNSNQTHLHFALTNTFGKIGKRQSYNKHFSLIERGTGAPEEIQISLHKKKIKSFKRN